MKKILTEWRKYLKEEFSQGGFPEKLYYATSIDNLPSIRDNGIVNLPTVADMSSDRMGVPTCQEMADASNYGNVILEIDGSYLQASGQFEPQFNSKGCRVKMRDSASGSGSGADVMVDRLGSRVPFEALTGAIFMGTPPVDKLKSSGFDGMKISSLTPEGELKTFYDPQDQN